MWVIAWGDWGKENIGKKKVDRYWLALGFFRDIGNFLIGR